MDRSKITNFVKAARDTGRSDRNIVDMLESDEITCLLNAPEAVYHPSKEREVMVAIRYIPTNLQGAKIHLIKMVRGMTCNNSERLGLLEAKQFIEGTRTLWLQERDAEVFRNLLGNDAVNIGD